MKTQDTICAIATAPGGAIGLIRVSGADAVNIVDGIFTPIGNNKTPLAERKPGTVSFGKITNDKNEVLDEVLVSVFHAPHSYTGENTAEISCHGSSYILQQVMQLLVNKGCRPAHPGEYTQRAFMNGKMDLSQAEAVADLIASSSAATHRMAMNQMRGVFSNELLSLRNELLHLTSLIELELDFSDHEELEFADRSNLSAIATRTEEIITRLVGSFSLGNAIKNGIPVAIIGDTNAGKSTLLNALVGDDRAIVSDIHGTTRDVIEDTVNISGTIFRFIDTAGIRETNDTIENLGIERTFKKISQAGIVLLMIDSTASPCGQSKIFSQIIPQCKDKHIIIVYNKIDIAPDAPKRIPSGFPEHTRTISISAKNGDNIDALKHLLLSYSNNNINNNDVIITNIRHYNALNCALDSIRRVQDGLTSSVSADIISQDLRETIYHLAEITGGEITTNEVLTNIFKHFCIGK